MYGASGAVGQLGANVTGSEAWGQRLTRDALIAPQVAIPEFAGFMVPAEFQALAQRAATKGEPWARMGRVPPPGTDPDFDKIHIEQAKLDMETLDEAHQALQGTTTLARSKDLAALIGHIVTDGKIEVSAEAVRKLYGGEKGQPIDVGLDDGKLGFVPDLREQMALAEKYGGDISVPIADWNARVDPDLHKELRESIRARPGGMTLEEGKEAKPETLAPEKLEGPSKLALTPAERRYFEEIIKPQYELLDEVPSIKLTGEGLEWSPEHTGQLVNWIDEARALRQRG